MRLYLKDFINIGNIDDIVAVSWQIAEDEDFKFIINEKLYSDEILSTFLPAIKSNGEYYTEEDLPLYARCKIHIDNGYGIISSDWYKLKFDDSNLRSGEITINGEVVAKYVRDKNGKLTISDWR